MFFNRDNIHVVLKSTPEAHTEITYDVGQPKLLKKLTYSIYSDVGDWDDVYSKISDGMVFLNVPYHVEMLNLLFSNIMNRLVYSDGHYDNHLMATPHIIYSLEILDEHHMKFYISDGIVSNEYIGYSDSEIKGFSNMKLNLYSENSNQSVPVKDINIEYEFVD